MATVEISCTVEYSGDDENNANNYSLTVNPSTAEADTGDTIEWTISQGESLPKNVKRVAITGIADLSGVDIFSGTSGREPSKEPGTRKKKWSGKVNDSSAGLTENYNIDYSVTLKGGKIIHINHDPRIKVRT